MNFNIDFLKESIAAKMSHKRYEHTIAVFNMAGKIGELLIPERLNELGCAALLHDIAKELPLYEQIELAKYSCALEKSDLATAPIIHSFAAPEVIRRIFPEYATKDIISAVFNHTVGSSDMSIFDEIIFVADFIEETRSYQASILTREQLFIDFAMANEHDEFVAALHGAVLRSIEYTIENIKSKNGIINEKILKTKSAISEKYNAIRNKKNGE